MFQKPEDRDVQCHALRDLDDKDDLSYKDVYSKDW